MDGAGGGYEGMGGGGGVKEGKEGQRFCWTSVMGIEFVQWIEGGGGGAY